MESFAPNVAALITDYWQRYPARHDVRAVIDRYVVSIYVNDEVLLERLRTTYLDQATIARPEILVAVIQDPALSPRVIMPAGSQPHALTVADGRIEWLPEQGLLLLCNRGRYMIGGDCLAHMDEVQRFIKSTVADWNQPQVSQISTISPAAKVSLSVSSR